MANDNVKAGHPDPEKSPDAAADSHGFDLRALENDYHVESTHDGSEKQAGRSWALVDKLRTLGVESRGIYPVPLEQRTDPQFSKSFFVWLSCNFNILSFSEGTLGTLVYGLTFKQAAGVIVGFNLLAILPPAYFSTFGPKLGLRQMVQARYSFGWFGAIIPGTLNLLGMTGYNILNAILGGQTLSVVSGGHMSWTVGIVVIGYVSMYISFFGYRILNWYERLAWFPILIVYLVVLGIGGKHLSHSPTPSAPARAVLSYASTVAGFVISYSPLMSDYTNYMRPEVSNWKVFWFSYLGLVVPTVTVQLIGAAFAAALPSNPGWAAGYDANGPGGLIDAVLSPAGRFGKFLTVLLGLSVIANMAPTLYSFSISFQVVLPFVARMPRYVFSILGTAVLIPLAIVGSTRFEETLVDFLGIVGYWSATFVAVILVEHVVFRRRDWGAYDLSAWNLARRLPPGIAALGACICAFGLIVPCMDQVWFVGPVAARTGDIGFEVGFVLSGVCYLVFRGLERRVFGR
ncbi:Permease for cytosine/purines, uracil, thiamine, allantoin [Ceratobasidium sp. AG-Ba]|nr:Permease for cytosine/purines, uracil, thiamine, allantoin [Ceratobasidium sp. AG-Ba]